MNRLKFIRIRTMHRLVLDNAARVNIWQTVPDSLQEVRNRACIRTLNSFFPSKCDTYGNDLEMLLLLLEKTGERVLLEI